MARGQSVAGGQEWGGNLVWHGALDNPSRTIIIWSSSVPNWASEALNVARKLDRITINPAVMNGQPCIRGMRFTVRRVVEAAALYPDRDELKREYPELEDEDIAQALDFAARNLDDQILPLEAA